VRAVRRAGVGRGEAERELPEAPWVGSPSDQRPKTQIMNGLAAIELHFHDMYSTMYCEASCLTFNLSEFCLSVYGVWGRNASRLRGRTFGRFVGFGDYLQGGSVIYAG